MKRQFANPFCKLNVTFVFSTLLIVLMILSTDALAQRRGRFGGHPYFSSRSAFVRGHFYAPAIGARIRVLPVGYASFRLGGLEYYYYDGLYYRYYPDDRVYVVVEKPKGAEKAANLKFDQVKMNDGSVVEGIFVGATDTTLTIKVGETNQEININDVKSVTFAPAAPTPNKK